ncbi:type VI secretion system baseplate subunit TssG [Massilia forsythiae]|uniref:Type VI secretion system baseplate subunit TssG n=1 Tax=Massilia forsythiae TaxID=2728020 RepID=A0A7Z2VYN0_9BURK|nr:type VI secretion system baseplate subunit TssG [Massilia forsythiae]QJE01563.1 type VI secretion system baseplate subunit TssG [Massilia forsythiae]
MPDLIAQLREAPHDFDLFQALSLLERSRPACAPVGTSLGLDESVRLAAQVTQGFAASDLAALVDSTQPGPPLTLRSPVLSLAGAHGPLPAPFTEALLELRRGRDPSGLDFLDIFNQRLLGFLYRSRRKHHLALAGGSVEGAPLVRALDALSSLGRAEGARGPDGEQAWLRHAAVQGAAPRSMASLLAVVRDRMGVPFRGRQFVGGWHPLARCDRARLASQGRRAGAESRLGQGASLGARAWDQGGGLALDAPPLAPARFAALLPGGPDHALLGWLVGRHLQRDMDVQVRLEPAARPVTRLGVPASAQGQTPALAPRLGLSAWLCSPGAGARPATYRPARFGLASAAPERT